MLAHQKLALLLSIALLAGAAALPNASATAGSGGALAVADTLRGTVIDAREGDPLAGVNVVVQGTTIGTATDRSGRYSLVLPATGADSLVFSFVGYERAVVAIEGQRRIDIALVSATYMGEELVVVGYGTVAKSDITGAMSSLQEDDFNKGVNTSVDQLIKGKIAGVRVVQSGGEPGAGMAVSIRGASSINAGTGPLYVIDGVPIDNSQATAGTGARFVGTRSPRDPLATINPADIASIEVLKDASATAIYGSRGANGVILVTTKSGGERGAMRINYEGQAGVQRAINRMQLLSPTEYQSVINAIIDEGGGNPEDRVTDISNATDWQQEILSESPVVHSHNLSLSGQRADTRFYMSLNAFMQDGVVVSSGLERYSGRINLNHDVSRQLGVGLNLSTSYTYNDYVPVGFGVNEGAGALYAAYNYDPTMPIRNASGEYERSPTLSIDNPLALANGALSDEDTYRTLGSAFAEYRVIPQLKAKVLFGFDNVNSSRDTYITRLTMDGEARRGVATILNGRQSNYLVEGTLTYDRTVGVHGFNILAGMTAQRFQTYRNATSGEGFPTDALRTYNLSLADPTTIDINSARFGNSLLSYIGRTNYSVLDKYLVTATVRVDGSSRFGKDNRFGVFPSLALAWKLGQEDFIRQTGLFSTLKLRGSWGRTGNQAIGNYQSQTTLGDGPWVIWDDQPVKGINPTRMGNPDLKWETTEQVDVGLDFGFLDDRIYGSVDYFVKDTYDMLYALPVPYETGFRQQLTNIGSVSNRGFELELTSRNLSGPFRWTTTANLATLANRVDDLGPIEEVVGGSAGFTNQIYILRPGEPMFSYYGWDVEGVWQTDDDLTGWSNVQPGDLKFRDVNGDQKINDEDRVILGNSIPDVTWAVGNTFGYKNLELDVFFEGVHGVSMLNNNLVDTYFPINLRRNKMAEPYLNRWTPENPSNQYPSFVRAHAYGKREVNSLTVQDASYIRLHTLRLSYQLPQRLTAVRAATIYGTVENLVTFTDYQGVDPAVNPNGNVNFRIDYNAYPLARSYTLGLRLGF